MGVSEEMGQMQWVVGLVVEKKGTEKQTWLGSTWKKKRGLIETMRKKKRGMKCIQWTLQTCLGISK